MTSELLVILLLVLANGLLAGAEIAIVSVRKTRLSELIEQGRHGARTAHRLRTNPERFLATVQVGITVIGATAGAFSGASLATRLAPVLRHVSWLEPYANEVALTLVIALLSYLSIVLGELVPKSLGLKYPEGYALLAARPLQGLATLMHPFVWLLTASSNLVLKAFGDHTTFTETRLSMEEIQEVVEEASRVGTLMPDAGEIVSRAIDFGALAVGAVMVHRRFVVALRSDANEEEIRKTFRDSHHQRLPVHDGSIDNVVGYLTWRDLFERECQGKPIVVKEILRPLHFVPETMRAVDLLKEMQRRRTQMAGVVEEHGGFAGIVTMEDLVEELVGEISSEHDAATESHIRKQPDGSALVQGTAPVREVNEALGLELPEPDGGSTMSWLCVMLAGARIPEQGERFVTEGVAIEVVERSARRVREVRVARVAEAAAAEAPA